LENTKKVFGYLIKSLFSSCIVLLVLFPLVLIAFYSRLFKAFSLKIKNPKVLIGIHEIASNIHTIDSCLRVKDLHVTSIVSTNLFSKDLHSKRKVSKGSFHYIPSFFSYKSSSLTRKIHFWLIYPLIKAYHFLRYFGSHDVVLIIWNETFLPWHLDLLLVKLSRKKLILLHCGDDVRYRPMQRVIDKSFDMHTWNEDEANLYLFLKSFLFVKISEWCGSVISIRDQATFQSKPMTIFTFPMPALLTEPKLPNDVLKIVHAPSCRSIKGTSIVLSAIENLRNESLDFEFIILENKVNKEVLDTLITADILIDQPGHGVARLAVEGCAAGCCIVGGNRPDYNNQFDSPIIQFERDDSKLAQVLSQLINDRDLVRDKMKSCYEFWKKYYTEDVFYSFFLDILNGSSNTFPPLPNQKELLLHGASNKIEYFIIKNFY
tara:strand:+ start:1653 stop:2951 length:1299 start_codon:yes stop_codon:yes gene_type:complete